MYIAAGRLYFLARENEIIAGSAALMKEQDDEPELVKMTVAEDGLFSNHHLVQALSLYRQFGFKDIAVGKSVLLLQM